MKQSHEVPVTAFQAGEGLLPAYQKLVREVVIPYQYQVLEDKQEGVEKSHALENLRLAAKKNRGEELTEDFYGMVFQDSDVAKWLEAAPTPWASSLTPSWSSWWTRSSPCWGRPSRRTAT